MDIRHLINIAMEISDTNEIERRIVMKDKHGSIRQENDSEHSYGMIQLAVLLMPYKPEVNWLKVIQLCTVHDIPEVIAGDTWYLDSDKEKKAKNELNAAKELFGNTHLMDLWLEYEKRETEEAKITKKLDILQCILQIVKHKGITWFVNRVNKETELSFKRPFYEEDDIFKEMIDQLFDIAEENGYFYK